MILFFTVITAILLTSCTTTSYYQVYKATPSNKLVTKGNSLIYEDGNCRISYNLWSEGGNIGFRFFNKTKDNIYLNLGASFFILNGIAHDYYKDRVFTNSSNSASATSRVIKGSKSVTGFNYLNLLQTNRMQVANSSGLIASAGYAISYNEEKIICIPPNTSKIIVEYTINKTTYRDCDLFKYPSKKQIKSQSFSKSVSPIVFSNRIAYTVGKSDNLIKIENEFYVSEITNYPESEMLESKYEEFCNQKSQLKKKQFKDVGANKFFITYKKGEDKWKH